MRLLLALTHKPETTGAALVLQMLQDSVQLSGPGARCEAAWTAIVCIDPKQAVVAKL